VDANLADRDTNSADANSADPDSVDSDLVDAADADIWEALVRGLDAAVDPEQRHTSGVPSPIPPSSDVPRPSTPPPDPPIDDSNPADSQIELTIDSFPHGRPGAPIAGALQGHSEYQSHEARGTSTWAPFHSQFVTLVERESDLDKRMWMQLVDDSAMILGH
jgi:hypothetical protein